MTKTKPSIAIIGAGMGGLAAAITLRKIGVDVTVYEQAPQFLRVGAGIQMLPNSSRVLNGMGILDRLRNVSFEPYSHLNRVWDTGEVKRELPMPEDLYGAPFLCMHRADLHEALCSALPPEVIKLNKKLAGLDQRGRQVDLAFADGTRATHDAVVAADGVHSFVRSIIVGKDAPLHKGRIAYRAVFEASRMPGEIAPSRTKWWGIDRHIVIYYTTPDRSHLYFVTSVPEPADWMTAESWSAKGDVKELRAAYEGFHPEVRMVLDACPDCHKWAILEREPLPHWSDGRVVLLGDACHPMTPYMAQGAATSIEDAAVLARCVEAAGGEDLDRAFRDYEANRKPRTSRIQAISSANTWMSGGNDDPSWLYGYDAWNVPLVEADASHTTASVG
ncbi:salicylate 1-monooxygenase [Pseudorhizobium pelagicum]|uniref:Salicylate 1-monooxygenase n=2 Tax=Pseudorhizobium pelagicum TaxID=1509405 RepID=A0A922P1G4_9HYPH|nr:salicylate 1-monooxygenase [Pseudorhizobium pelagicum]KEQ04443.1 salicylate 1-monooxygenase [Pseudorhizobium pelagicum]